MSKFSTRGKEPQINEGKYISELPGVHALTISQWKPFTANSGTNGVNVVFNDDHGKEAEMVLFFSDSAYEYTESKILLMIDSVGGPVRSQFDNAMDALPDSASWDSVSKVPGQFLTGKKLYFIVGGKESIWKDKSNVERKTMKAEIYATGQFCCNLNDTTTLESMRRYVASNPTKFIQLSTSSNDASVQNGATVEEGRSW